MTVFTLMSVGLSLHALASAIAEHDRYNKYIFVTFRSKIIPGHPPRFGCARIRTCLYSQRTLLVRPPKREGRPSETLDI